MHGVCVSPIYIRARSWPNLPMSFPGGNLGGVRERKDLQLSLSPELLYKAGKLPPDLRQMFKSSPTKKVLLFWSGCLLRTQTHLVNPSTAGLGECVCCIISDPLLQFLPSLSHSCVRETQTRSLAGTRSSISLVFKICIPCYCLLPLTDTVGLSAASLSVSFMCQSGERQREEGLGDEEVGEKKAG